MRNTLQTLWTPAAPSPLLRIAATLLAYGLGKATQRAFRNTPPANPVLIAILLMAVLLEATGTPYRI
jgi:putative effector of murein hydrolase